MADECPHANERVEHNNLGKVVKCADCGIVLRIEDPPDRRKRHK